MVDDIFRLYDIRGKIGPELALDEVYDLGRAIAAYFLQKNTQVKKVAVGADGRVHSPAITQEVCNALQESGLDVIFVGPCPTPVVYFAIFNMPVDAGLMITASHNGPEYNGIKICLGKEAVWGSQIQEIKRLTRQKVTVSSSKVGTYEDYDLIEDYSNWLVQHFPHLIGMDLKVLIDCGNGAAGMVMPRLIKKMKWQHVSLLYPEVDGTYPNHEADPIVEKNMQDLKKALLTGTYDVGLGFDGDCDRMTPMTKQGSLVSGDKLLALFAQEILKVQRGAGVVFDIKCSSGLSELLKKWGGMPFISASGHSIIKDQLKKTNALLAGELSCHFFFNDRYFGYDDGIYAALRLFELLKTTCKSLEELLQVFPQKFATPEIRIACPLEKMSSIVNRVKGHFLEHKQADVMTIDGIRVMMDYGWGLVRPSNTQPVICLRFESDSSKGLEQLKRDFMCALEPYFTQEVLRKEFDQ
jgi:phosphomannomutase / phosphoglucomutase